MAEDTRELDQIQNDIETLHERSQNNKANISAHEAVKMRKQEEWNDILETFIDDPVAATNHLVMGMNLEQRRKARGKTKSSVPTWV